jgi:hypothetical protein
MLPPLNENGYLPPGVHVATIDEVVNRFGQQSELRRAQAESLRWLIDLARRAGVERVVVNGSFVTDALEPNDVDCVLLIGANNPQELEAAEDLHDGLPFIDLHLVEETEFELLVTDIFGTDRDLLPKGVVEVLL